MKRLVIIAAIALASCAGGNDNKGNAADTVKTTGDTTTSATTLLQDKAYCFVRTEGTTNQDTTTVLLTLKGTEVTGEMNWLPKEKDARKGTLSGTIDGDNISAVWSFMQEGVKDSIKVAFKLSPQKLLQKPLKTNTANGQQQTDETAGYTIEYSAGNCGPL